MKSILLYPNPDRDRDFHQTKTVANILKEFDAVVYAPEEILKVAPDSLDFAVFLPLAAALRKAQLIISLGGDGTLLRCAKYASLKKIPILGVNLGNIGMLAELEPDEYHLIGGVFSGEYSVDRRMMLKAEADNCGLTSVRHVLNDIVVSRGTVGQAISLKILVDGHHLYDLSGDGVIISTPTGSSGYSLSSGGPLVESGASSILITPICPYASNAHSIVLDADKNIEIITDSLPERRPFMSADGGAPVKLKCAARIRVEKSRRYTDILRLKERGYFEIIQDKLKRSRR